MALNEKEKTTIKDLQTQEQTCIKKYKKYGQDAKDPVLKDLFSTLEKNEQKHYDTLGQILEGKVPECDCNDCEGKEYEEIDLSGLEKLTIRDAIDTQLELFGVEVAASVLCETTTAFARTMAAKATGLPIEFFKLMPRGAFRRVAGMVRRYMNADGETENHVMQLGKPRSYKGKEYREIDLNGVADLNTLNESEAENRMAREGFAVTENGTNYLYACVIASMATGIPEDFFTSLPLYELLKLKNAVNDADFFE